MESKVKRTDISVFDAFGCADEAEEEFERWVQDSRVFHKADLAVRIGVLCNDEDAIYKATVFVHGSDTVSREFCSRLEVYEFIGKMIMG